jgi:hypothetical protein
MARNPNPASEQDWAEADEVSDRMIEMLNERVEMVSGVEQLLMGVLLGLLGFLRTARTEVPWPESLVALQAAAHLVVEELIEAGPGGKTREDQT